MRLVRTLKQFQRAFLAGLVKLLVIEVEKMGFTTLKSISVLTLAVFILGVPPVSAQDSIDINALRAQFSKNQAKGKTGPATISKGMEGFSNIQFSDSIKKSRGNSVIDNENSKLAAEEAALLEKLGNTFPEKKAEQDFPKTEVVQEEYVETAASPEQDTNFTDELSILISEYDALKSKYVEQAEKLKEMKSDNNVLSGKVTVFQAKNSELRQELEELRNRLIVAETEVSRLSAVLRSSNRSKLGYSSKKQLQKTAAIAKSLKSKSVSPKISSDGSLSGETAIVTVDKANLRAGPGTNNSPLMTVAKGTRLFVETREGEWYRVITPTNTRAWISSEVVTFGTARDGRPTKTLRVKGYDQTL